MSQSYYFNGAALSEARKRNKWQKKKANDIRTSMGPRFRKRGNNSLSIRVCGNINNFNGAALSEARKHHDSGRESAAPPAALQWGRAFGSAETYSCKSFFLYYGVNFNGAALSEARKQVLVSYCR